MVGTGSLGASARAGAPIRTSADSANARTLCETIFMETGARSVASRTDATRDESSGSVDVVGAGAAAELACSGVFRVSPATFDTTVVLSVLRPHLVGLGRKLACGEQRESRCYRCGD